MGKMQQEYLARSRWEGTAPSGFEARGRVATAADQVAALGTLPSMQAGKTISRASQLEETHRYHRKLITLCVDSPRIVMEDDEAGDDGLCVDVLTAEDFAWLRDRVTVGAKPDGPAAQAAKELL